MRTNKTAVQRVWYTIKEANTEVVPQGRKLYYSLSELRANLGLGGSTIRRMVSRGHFPQPIQISPRRIVWLAEEIEQWVKSRSAQRLTPRSWSEV